MLIRARQPHPAYNGHVPRKRLPIKRDQYVRVNLLPAERAHLEARARDLDISLSAYVRLLIKADIQEAPTAQKPAKK